MRLRLAIATLALLAGAASSYADAPGDVAAQERFCALCDAKHRAYEAVPWLEWGMDVRLREVFAPNLLLDREDRHFQRYRLRAWTGIKPVDNLRFDLRLVYEPRHFCQPAREARTRNAYYIDEWTLSEAIFDRASVTWSKAMGLPLTVTVGRQDIIFGNGWLVLDGTPLDGSRTIFFDAIRATYDAKEIQTTFDVIYICQQADSDQQWFAPFCDKDFHNMEQDEKGVILYATNKSLDKTQIDGYFIYKHDDADIGTEFPENEVAPWQMGKNSDIFAIGARVVHAFDDHWKLRAEFAQEVGHKEDFEFIPNQGYGYVGHRLCAFGFNSLLSYDFKDAMANHCHVGYEYLSGDKNSSGKNEQFDQLWGRWPQWSELYVYAAALENRPGEVVNHHRINLGWSCSPMEDLSVLANYNLVFTDKNSFSERGYFSDSGCLKGQNLTGLVKYRFDEHWSTHVYAELFFPGDYYDDSRNETAGFFRWEVMFTW